MYSLLENVQILTNITEENFLMTFLMLKEKIVYFHLFI